MDGSGVKEQLGNPVSAKPATTYRPTGDHGTFVLLRKWRIWLWCWWALLSATTVLPAYAAGPQLIDHSFAFDARWDSNDIEVLDYRYGEDAMTRAPDYQVKAGKVGQMTAVHGPFLRGDSLYVKWRIKSTGETYEETVDLRQRLPADITRHEIYFVVRGPQLHVYLISPEKVAGLCPEDMTKAAKTMAPSERIFRLYCDRKIFAIYPNQPRF
jgi:hypothetical protein